MRSVWFFAYRARDLRWRDFLAGTKDRRDPPACMGGSLFRGASRYWANRVKHNIGNAGCLGLRRNRSSDQWRIVVFD
jgi:hypothetical protein